MKTAIVLGGTAPHIELIEELQRRGYYVVLVDYFENPPAKAYANEHVRESTLDKDTVLRIAAEKNAELVIASSVDQANIVCCYVAEKLGLPHPYSYQTADLVTVKTEMKRVMRDHEIPTSWFIPVDDVQDVDWSKVTYPAVVKPVDCNGSKGVRRVEDASEAQRYLAEAVGLSRSGKAIIEGFVEGKEIQVDCFAEDDGAVVLLTRQKKQFRRDSGEEMNSEGSILPAPVCDENVSRQTAEIATKIARAFHLRNTPFFYQAIVDKSGAVQVLELAARIGGGLSGYILKNIVGIDMVKLIVDSYFGTAELPRLTALKHLYSTNLLYMNDGIFDHISGFEEAKRENLVLETFVTKERGARVEGRLQSRNRVGAFIVQADTMKELTQKENAAYQLIRVFDADGVQQMKRIEKDQ